MKKIILLLSAAIICVGIALGFNMDKSTGAKNENSIAQDDSGAKGNSKSESDANKSTKADGKEDNSKNQKAEKDKSANENKDSSKNNDNKSTEGNKTTDNSKVENKEKSSEDNKNKPSSDKKDSEDKKPEGTNDVDKKDTVTLSININTAIKYGINKKDGFTHLPSNGVVLSPQKVEFKEGDTVFDVFSKVVKAKGIQMEYTGAGSAIYIEGIDNLYEFDCGKYSGWMYEVNGWYPNYGVGAYKLKKGDNIVFNYTCDLGKDLGAPVN